MLKAYAWVVAGVVAATANVAHAQQRPASPPAVSVAADVDAAQAVVPWYERFTTSSGITQSITGDRENDRSIAPTWSLNQHWGVTVDVRQAQRIERDPTAHGDQTSVGAFYQFTPSLRVGGQVSVETPSLSETTTGAPRSDEPHAGVRIESAFRF